MATSVKPRIEQLDHMMALCIVDSDSTENEGSPPITVNESSAQSTRSTSPSWVGRLALASTDRSGHSGLARLRKKSSLNAVLSRPQATPPSPEVTELQHWSGTCGPRSGGARSRDLGAVFVGARLDSPLTLLAHAAKPSAAIAMSVVLSDATKTQLPKTPPRREEPETRKDDAAVDLELEQAKEAAQQAMAELEHALSLDECAYQRAHWATLYVGSAAHRVTQHSPTWPSTWPGLANLRSHPGLDVGCHFKLHLNTHT